jgi:hypothetical protein
MEPTAVRVKEVGAGADARVSTYDLLRRKCEEYEEVSGRGL